MFLCATPIWWRDGAIGVHQQKLNQIIFPMQKTSRHLELWVKSTSHSRGRCPGCQDFANFRGALQQLPKLTAYSPKKAMQTCLLLKPFSHLAKGVVPAIKTHLPHPLGNLLSNHSATSLCSKTAREIREILLPLLLWVHSDSREGASGSP